MVGTVTVSDTGRGKVAGGRIGAVVDFVEFELLFGLGKARTRFARTSSCLDTIVGNDSNGSEDGNDDDDDEEFDDGEGGVSVSMVIGSVGRESGSATGNRGLRGWFLRHKHVGIIITPLRTGPHTKSPGGSTRYLRGNLAPVCLYFKHTTVPRPSASIFIAIVFHICKSPGLAGG